MNCGSRDIYTSLLSQVHQNQKGVERSIRAISCTCGLLSAIITEGSEAVQVYSSGSYAARRVQHAHQDWALPAARQVQKQGQRPHSKSTHYWNAGKRNVMCRK